MESAKDKLTAKVENITMYSRAPKGKRRKLELDQATLTQGTKNLFNEKIEN
jgi:hypothetical protein